MESSVGLVFRALVMLACLAAVPLVAMFGKYVPDFAQAVMEAYKARSQTNAAADPKATGSDAPPFAGQPTRTETGGLSTPVGPQSATGAPAPWTDFGQSARPLSDWQQPTRPAPVGQNADLERASFNAPVGHNVPPSAGDAPPWNAAANGSAAPSRRPPPSGANHVPASGDPRGGEAASVADAEGCTGQFRRMEQRLRELGATYYLLETWGPSGERYRFFCKMAIAGNADYNRNRIFQATAGDPLRAMQDVLEQVEQWRAGRQP